jgi:hypothetical protein
MIPHLVLTLPGLLLASMADPAEAQGQGPRFAVSFGRELGDKPFEGRLLLLMSN